MTCVNAIVQPGLIAVASDTVGRSISGEPLRFVSKLLALPHLSGLICGTGYDKVLIDWWTVLQQQFIVRDLDEMNEHAQRGIQRLIRDVFQRAEDFDLERAGCIYHFGWSQRRQRCVAFSYQADRDWAPVEYEPGNIIIRPKPDEIPTPPAEFEAIDDLVAWHVQLIEQQRTSHKPDPKWDGARLGGDVHLGIITETTISIQRIHRFPEYESDFNAMRLRALKER